MHLRAFRIFKFKKVQKKEFFLLGLYINICWKCVSQKKNQEAFYNHDVTFKETTNFRIIAKS